MTERNKHRVRRLLQDPQRLAARGILAALMALLVFAVVATPLGGPFTRNVSAQTSPSPSNTTSSPSGSPSGSPTGSPSSSPSRSPSPSPTPTGGTEINFLNPSETSSNEISAKNDGTDTAYHLVAAVRDENLPEPSVIFQFENTSQNVETTIGPATRVGTSDTWEFDWDVTNVPDGTYQLKAVYFSGSTEVGRDEDTIVVNNAGSEGALPGGGEQAETVEILYPVNAGTLGFFTTGTGANAVTRAVFDVSVSDGTTDVIAFYSVAPPGQQPDYIECGTADAPDEGSTTQVRCALEDNTVDEVTAVAVVANDGADDPVGIEVTESSDGHRVFGYIQEPTNVSLSPASQNQPTGICSQVITATVTDQNGRTIADVNVDVHAQGPTDNLFFDDNDTSNNSTSSSKAPDQNHTTDEAAANCESTTSPPNRNGTQGQHENPDPSVPGGSPDVKHIESTLGTNLQGQFGFRLTSSDAGGTSITAWADEDNNDQRCSEEVFGNASIGWNVVAPVPTTVTTDGDGNPCPSPTPTMSPTPTGSPTPSPSPTGSPGPGGDECPTFEGDSRNQIVGTPDDDQLEGTEGDDIICGLGGNDTIDGLGGNDVLIGGDGNDIIRGGDGNDDLDGGDGKDDLRGNGGDDFIDGGLQNDIMLGNEGNDTMIGRSGDDIARGGGGSDQARGGGGKDTLQGGIGTDDLRGGGGDDTLKGGAGGDDLRGGKDNDFIKGGSGPDDIRGGRGNDTCSGGKGRDSVRSCEN